MIQFKAALFTGGNVAEFIRRAANNYVGDFKLMACAECNSDMTMSPQDESYHMSVSGKQLQVKVHGVPTYVCSHCEEQIVDVKLSAKIEEYIEEEVLYRLNGHDTIPTDIYFNQLIGQQI
ncbi:hypothetical protein [Paenibacillus thiaminolyticus]|nr:hypothetical protein [Paenibacillus thiaminolyticus]